MNTRRNALPLTKLAPWAAVAAMTAACVSTPGSAPTVQVVDAAAVSTCSPLGDLHARSLRDSGSPAADLQRAKEQLLVAARERGASHLVISELDLRYALALARGRAYRCG